MATALPLFARNTMNLKRSVTCLSLLLAVACAISAQSNYLKRTTVKTDRLDFGAGGTVSIVGAPIGSIRVEPAATSELQIEATIELQAATEADLAKLAEVTNFVLDESLGRVSIISTGTHDRKFLKQVAKKFPKNLLDLPFRIDYVVKVPRYCDLQIDGGKGDISVAGIEGALKINSLESNATLSLVGGGVNATFGAGTVDITMPDRSWRGNAIDISLGSGTMNIHVPVNLSAELDAAVLRTGQIENSLQDLKPRVRTVKFTDKSIAAKAGAGGVPMKFTVGDGTLKLSRIGISE
ncbi:MAG TPA: hypothetical protein VHL50_06950 [Pyrinomonadaceae bacterium]|nr:hypothetical protein [Pyrinomonadaceae bacterium]